MPQVPRGKTSHIPTGNVVSYPLPHSSLATRNLEFNTRGKYNFPPNPVSSLAHTCILLSTPHPTVPIISFSWCRVSFLRTTAAHWVIMSPGIHFLRPLPRVSRGPNPWEPVLTLPCPALPWAAPADLDVATWEKLGSLDT